MVLSSLFLLYNQNIMLRERQCTTLLLRRIGRRVYGYRGDDVALGYGGCDAPTDRMDSMPKRLE